MIAIDTNLLVYAHRSAAREHRAARKAIERASKGSAGCGIAAATLAEFWAVVTQPSLARPSRPDEARDFLASLTEDAGIQIWPLPLEVAFRLPRVAADLGVRGNRIFDLQIALSAVHNGATEIWTHDSDFVSVPGLTVRDPLSA